MVQGPGTPALRASRRPFMPRASATETYSMAALSRSTRSGPCQIARPRVRDFREGSVLGLIESQGTGAMKREIEEESEGGRLIPASLVTTWVMAAMLLVMTTFLAQFPEVPATRPPAAAAR